MSTQSIDQILGAIIAWLEPRQADLSQAALRGWEAQDWALAQKVIFMQGVGPSLHQSISSSAWLASTLPAGLRDYLADQVALNCLRIERIHTNLAAILKKAHRVGIEIIPLKGSLLTTQAKTDHLLRPMADIDLLIRPADREAMNRLLEECGYQKNAPKTLYTHHDHYSRPQDRVVKWDGEHPDNPIPVEVHTSLRRVYWADKFIPDLAPSLWESAHPGEILGQPAWIADTEIHYAYLCLHAMVHLTAYRGRLSHWLDLARLTPHITGFNSLPYPDMLYPVIRLAWRALPGAFTGVELGPMADLVQARIRHWADHIPLNSRCGLVNHLPAYTWLGERWEYWHPTIIRLALAYPKLPLPAAAVLFLGDFMHHMAKRAGKLLAGGR